MGKLDLNMKAEGPISYEFQYGQRVLTPPEGAAEGPTAEALSKGFWAWVGRQPLLVRRTIWSVGALVTVGVIAAGVAEGAMAMYKSIDESTIIAQKYEDERNHIPLINHTIDVDNILNAKQDAINITLDPPIAAIQPTIREIKAEKDPAKRHALELRRSANVNAYLAIDDPAHHRVAADAQNYFFAADDASACLVQKKCDEATWHAREDAGFCAMIRTYGDFVTDQRALREDFAANFVKVMANVDCQKILYH